MSPITRMFGACLIVAGTAVPTAAQKQSEPARTPGKSAGETPRPSAKAEGIKDQSSELLAAIEQLKGMVAQQSRELAEQRAALRAQQERMQALETKVQQAQTAASSAATTASGAIRRDELETVEKQLEAVAESQNQANRTLAKTTADLTAATRSNDGKFRQLGNFRFSGDARIRYESFLHDGALARNRYRVRARFNLTGNITDELYGGISLATGSLDDVNSTNQTFTSFFTRKNIGFDRMFVQYKPRWAAANLRTNVTLHAGKFAYPWVRTNLTFDSDINPEGFAQTLAWDFKNDVFKNLTVVSFQLPLSETGGSLSSTTGLVTSPGYDSWIFGGQVQTRWKLAERVNLALHIAGVNFINSDRVAAALGAGLSPSLANSNTLRTDDSGATLGYASRFLYLDTIAQMDIRTNSARWPITVLFNFENNLRATRILQSGAAAPTAQVDNPERSAYWAEVLFGRQNEQKDIQFGYAFVRIEKDAVIGAFNESDLRSSTNVRNHRLSLGYQALRNVQLSYTLWLGKLVNAQENQSLVPNGERLPGTPCATSPFTGCQDSLLKRMQLDLVYRF